MADVQRVAPTGRAIPKKGGEGNRPSNGQGVPLAEQEADGGGDTSDDGHFLDALGQDATQRLLQEALQALPTKAEEAAKLAAEGFSKSHDACMRSDFSSILASASLKLGKTNAALSAAKEATELDDRGIFAHFTLGKALDASYQVNKAKEAFERADGLLKLAAARERQFSSLPQDVASVPGSVVDRLLDLSIIARAIDQRLRAARPLPSQETQGIQTEASALHFIRLAAKRKQDSTTALRDITKKFPDLLAAKRALVDELLRVRPDEAAAITEALALLLDIMRARPSDKRALIDYATLLHKVQMARSHMKTHPVGSLSRDIMGFCRRVLMLDKRSVEALRLQSVQYRLLKDYDQARASIVMALECLFDATRTLVRLAACSSDPPPKREYPADATRFTLESLPEILGLSADELASLGQRQFLSLSRWISFSRSDLSFIDASDAHDKVLAANAARRAFGGTPSGDPSAEALNELAMLGFGVAVQLYKKHPAAYFGMAKVYETQMLDETRPANDRAAMKEHCIDCLCRSYSLQPSFSVEAKLKELNLDMDAVRQRIKRLAPV